MNALTVDSGHLWVAEQLVTEAGGSRVDEFNAGSGAYVPPQLPVGNLGGGIAVGHAGGVEQVYVGEGGGVGVFAAGHQESFWTGEHTKNGLFAGEHGILTGVAVDNSLNPETAGDVYVSTAGANGDTAFSVVDVFKPAVGGKEPTGVVGVIKGTCVSPETICAGDPVAFPDPSAVAVSGFNGDVLVANGGAEGCGKGCVVDVFAPSVMGEYEFVRQLTGTPAGAFGRIPEGDGVAFDGKGDIYVVDVSGGVVDEFDAEGVYLGRIAGTCAPPAGSCPGTVLAFHTLTGVAVDPDTEDVYVGDYDNVTQAGAVDVFGANITIPDVEVTEPPLHLQPTSVVLRGTVNPDAAGAATCEFEYGTSSSYGSRVPCTKTVGEGNSPVGVESGGVSGLEPDTRYFYRLDATNLGDGFTNTGQGPEDEGGFTTPGPGLHGESVSDVSSTAATLDAAIDPDGAATSFYFQYGRSSEYETTIPLTPAGVGEGGVDVDVERHLQGLAPGTVYHYRVVVLSKGETFAEPDQTFTTQAASGGLVLPDGRAWELVSPPDKHGALLSPIAESGVVQASSSGDAVTYIATSPTEDGVKGFFEAVQMISTRSPSGGWSSQDISLPHAVATGGSAAEGLEYRFFSSDLSNALVEPQGQFVSLAPEESPSTDERTPYIRHDAMCTSEPEGCYQPLLTPQDVPEGTKFNGDEANVSGAANFVCATPDLKHVVLSSTAALVSEPAKEGGEALYEFMAGDPASEPLTPISVLPDGAMPKANARCGRGNEVARNAVTEEGTRVVWSEDGGHLYLRDTAKGQTVQLDVPEAGCLTEHTCGTGVPKPQFQFASSDGGRVFFTDRQRLTAGSGAPEEPDLYECEIVEEGGVLGCRLSDLTPAAGSGESAAVQGTVLGASEDGSWVYFVANGILGHTGEHGAVHGNCKVNVEKGEGLCNLYVWHDGVASLVAVVSGEDDSDWASISGSLSGLTARVSSDGGWLAFMSDRSLTGYDTRDVNSGMPDEEVYMFDAATGGVVCASCDPSGARPTGVEYGKEGRNMPLSGGDGRMWEPHQSVAANVPGWTAYRGGRALYQSRYLSDEGRLFFDSRDSLVAADVNSGEDVYEWEPVGVGGCVTGGEGFVVGGGGCVGLISSGVGSGESVFLDASVNGNDVFFLTAERLVRADVDTALDVYDAHVCSTEAPCVSEAERPPACETADSCRAAPSPQPSIFGAPGSATFAGEGNLPTVAAGKPVVLTRAQKLARALKACRTKRSKKKRVACERQARRTYGAKAKKARKAAKKATRQVVRKAAASAGVGVGRGGL
ncbi:MAG: hypothetical protein ACLP1Q_07875 [Solirubrobacteraceae bacterium]